MNLSFHISAIKGELANLVYVTGKYYSYEHLARSEPATPDDSLSADSYLNVLHMPSAGPRTERSRPYRKSTNGSFTGSVAHEDGPRSNLNSVRYLECVNYFQEVCFYNQQDCIL